MAVYRSDIILPRIKFLNAVMGRRMEVYPAMRDGVVMLAAVVSDELDSVAL